MLLAEVGQRVPLHSGSECERLQTCKAVICALQILPATCPLGGESGFELIRGTAFRVGLWIKLPTRPEFPNSALHETSSGL